ncbi:MAG TPA: hypothetical protein DCL21_01710 [Alphaproteobacteria bacterium]|nr:hypothetical protein [Alphaproteobacteria bacterium]
MKNLVLVVLTLLSSALMGCSSTPDAETKYYRTSMETNKMSIFYWAEEEGEKKLKGETYANGLPEHLTTKVNMQTGFFQKSFEQFSEDTGVQVNTPNEYKSCQLFMVNRIANGISDQYNGQTHQRSFIVEMFESEMKKDKIMVTMLLCKEKFVTIIDQNDQRSIRETSISSIVANTTVDDFVI